MGGEIADFGFLGLEVFGLGDYRFWVWGFGGEGGEIADFDVGVGGGRDSRTDGDRVGFELAYASTFGGLLLAFPCYVEEWEVEVEGGRWGVSKRYPPMT